MMNTASGFPFALEPFDIIKESSSMEITEFLVQRFNIPKDQCAVSKEHYVNCNLEVVPSLETDKYLWQTKISVFFGPCEVNGFLDPLGKEILKFL